MAVDSTRDAKTSLVVRGLSSAELRTLRELRAEVRDSVWRAFLRVSVASGDSLTPTAGAFAVDDAVARFTPRFAFDAGRAYDAVLNPAIVGRTDSARVRVTVSLPAASHAEVTEVTAIYPSGDSIPENALRFYIELDALDPPR